MNKKVINLLLLAAIFIFTGCANLQTQKVSNSLGIVILSPIIKINDVGFLHKSKNSLNLQIYSSGVNTLNLKIADQICINRACYKKREFNQEFFAAEHYDDFLAEILEKKPIYNGIDVITNSCGFIQDISKYSLKYEVCGNDVKFNDTKNRIKILIKELQ